VRGFGNGAGEGTLKDLRRAHSLGVHLHSVWVLEVGTTGHPVKGAGEVDAHHESYKDDSVPQLVLSVVGDTYGTQDKANKQRSLHVEKLTENGVDH